MKTNLKLNTKANTIVTKTLYSVNDEDINFPKLSYSDKYLNGMFTFSISIQQDDVKSWMYCWTLAIAPVEHPEDHTLIYGETYDDFKLIQQKLINNYGISENRKAIMYMHNLSIIYTYFKNKLNFVKTRSKGKNQEYLAYQDNGFIWKCMAALTALGNLEELTKTSYVPYTYESSEDGLKNNLSSCLIQLYILDLMSKDNGYTSLQNTACAIARQEVRNAVRLLDGYNLKKYYTWRKHLSLDADKFIILNNALHGGDISFNPDKQNLILEASSYDKSSSYSSVMMCKKYPYGNMIKLNNCTLEKLNNLIDHEKLFVVDCYFNNVKIKKDKQPCWSGKEDKLAINDESSRLLRSRKFRFAGTNIDFKLFIDHYDFESINIINAYAFSQSDYLPNWLRQLIYSFYSTKTSYKNVDEAKYKLSKLKLENLYGLTVKSPIYDKDLDTSKYDTEDIQIIQEALDKYNNNKYDYLLPYCIGVFVVSYARQDLAIMREKLKDDFIMCDTDSLKFENDHSKEFEEHNKTLYEDMLIAGLTPYEFTAVDKDGVVHQLGEWQYEGHGKIKVVGLKQYGWLDDNGSQKTTIAGCSKKAIDYLKSIGLSALDISTDLEIPKEYSGKRHITHKKDHVFIKLESFKIGK